MSYNHLTINEQEVLWRALVSKEALNSNQITNYFEKKFTSLNYRTTAHATKRLVESSRLKIVVEKKQGNVSQYYFRPTILGIIAFFKIEEIKEFGVLAFESDKTGKSLEDIWETKDHIKEQLKIFLPDIVEDIFKNKYAKYDLLHSLSIAINSIDFKNVFNPIHIDNTIKTKIDIENNIENTTFTFNFDRFVYEKDLERELVDLIQFLIIVKMTHYENPDDDNLFHKSLQTFQTRMFKKIVKKNPYYTNIVKSIQGLQNNLGVWEELEKHGKTQKNTTWNVPNQWSDSK